MPTKPKKARVLSIRYVPLDEVQRAPRNPKAHDLPLLREAMEELGFLDPLILDGRTGFLIGGHGRTDALAEMKAAGEKPPAGVQIQGDGDWAVPLVEGFVSKSDAEAERALLILNRAPEKGGWLNDGLVDMLSSLSEMDMLRGTGFSADDLDDLRLMGERHDLDGLHEKLGKHAPEDVWPRVVLVFPPDTKQRFEAFWSDLPGDTDSERFEALVLDWKRAE